MFVVRLLPIIEDGVQRRPVIRVRVEPCVNIFRLYRNDASVMARSRNLWRRLVGDCGKLFGASGGGAGACAADPACCEAAACEGFTPDSNVSSTAPAALPPRDRSLAMIVVAFRERSTTTPRPASAASRSQSIASADG